MFFLLSIISMLIAGCDSGQISRRKMENISLRKELEARWVDISSIQDFSRMLDSIDVSRNAVIAGDAGEPLSVSTRLLEINRHVKQSEEKIDFAEKRLEASGNFISGYLMMIDALKDEMEIRTEEIRTLQSEIEGGKEQKRKLFYQVKQQNNSADEMQQEMVFLDMKLQGILTNLKISEADALYARAKALEETARRSKIASVKKHNTYREALELYKKALALGKEEARPSIEALERILFMEMDFLSMNK
jgi:chromosome segregation ATPase